ncbi:tripartite tricarboxylate transporter substrate binding protein [Clostridium transplantifaecale]|uniref:tripartite tricarboxylate transporter substrate binding protein n=1 Tax=Clostridium transplantifaecale TaxID=2479838 RepID=UPI000F643F23|nr:tripartite tricarboxylate transporter substrate binding protein [Clostridium transplantifaecale]
MTIKNVFLGLTLALCTAVPVLSGCADKNSSNKEAPQAETEKQGEDFSLIFTKPIEIICPWAEGGSADANARTIGQVVGEKTGQTVTVFNRTGRGGAAGFEEQMNAEPDGYTLGIITAELNTLPPQGVVDFSQQDFYPVIRMNTLPACVAVAADAPYTSLEELISYAAEHPGSLRTGNVGEGSIWHICAAKLERQADISLQHLSYDGASSAAEALVNGELDMVTLETSVMHAFAETGQVRILAVMAEERLSSFPAYPTCKELGYPVVSGSFQGIVCPMDVPQKTKDALERLFTEAYQSQAYQTFCNSYGLEKSFLNAAQFRTFLEEDLESVTKILKDLELTD